MCIGGVRNNMKYTHQNHKNCMICICNQCINRRLCRHIACTECDSYIVNCNKYENKYKKRVIQSDPE